MYVGCGGARPLFGGVPPRTTSPTISDAVAGLELHLAALCGQVATVVLVPLSGWCVRGCPAVPLRRAHQRSNDDGIDMWLYQNLFCDTRPSASTFVEIGANDGISASNTLMFEEHLGWRGLLVEGHPLTGARLLRSPRVRASNTIIPEAVCDRAGSLVFGGEAYNGVAGVINTMSAKYKRLWSKVLFQKGRVTSSGATNHNYSVPCRPMASMLEMAGLSRVRLFSLDVEGAELHVLRTIDFSRIEVGVFVVELDGSDKKKDNAVRHLLAAHGYMKLREIRGKNQVFIPRRLADAAKASRAHCKRCGL